MKKSLLLSLIVTSLINSACAQETVNNATLLAEAEFSESDAKANLAFAKDQYLKLITHLNNKQHLHPRPSCETEPTMICVPRSEEHNRILLEQSEKWTNGFFPGVLWKLLAVKSYISNWNEQEEETLFKTAQYYQQTLLSEAERGSTHDLGFILYDSFGEALNYDGLDDQTKALYRTTLDLGRATLASRYNGDVGVIRSWDWTPTMKVPTLENGEQRLEKYSLANPWTYPVIVDNMMNLEYLFTSDSVSHQKIAFDHAKHTSINHYFYDESDTEQQYPLAYHVFDYGEHKPGNWQGVGNISAWARGQAWSLYGFVTVVEAMKDSSVDLSDYPNFHDHLMRLYGSIEHLLQQDGVVPYWDFFADRTDAYVIAENISEDTAVFSGILGLCDKLIEDNIKPYSGYRPMVLNASMLSDQSLQRLEGKVSWHGEPIIQGDKLIPCGTKDYPASHTKIPRDTSAAAIFAAALYRYASFTNNDTEAEKFAGLADKIMVRLTRDYRTDRDGTGRENSVELGFVLSEATGDMGNGGEIDTPIIYGDFYFVEANTRKLEYEQARTTALNKTRF